MLTYSETQYVGSIAAAWCTYGTFKIDNNWSWRIPSLIQGALPALQLSIILFIPESPRYLVSRGKVEKARAILTSHHAGGDAHSPLVEFELNEIEETLRAESNEMSSTSWYDLIRTPANRRRTLIAVIVGWFSQWCGVGVVSYYITLVLNTIGITETKDQTLINGLLQIFNLIVASLIGAMLVDRAGRRKLFLVSTAGMLASYIIWTALSAHFNQTKSEPTGRAVVAFIFIYYFFYDIAWNPLLQAYPVEIFPYTLRGRGLTVSYLSAFVGLILGNQVNSIAMSNIGWKYYILFCCLLGLMFVLVWFLFPETKGRTLEEIAEVFEERNQKSSSEDLKVGETRIDDWKGKTEGSSEQIEYGKPREAGVEPSNLK